MAQRFIQGSGTRVALPAASTLHDILTGAIVARIYPNRYPDGTNLRGLFNSNANATGFRAFSFGPTTGSNALRFQLDRVTTDITIEVSPDNLPFGGAKKWLWVAALWDTAGVNGDQRIFGGDLSHPFQEAAAYVTQLVGTGTSAETANAGNIGNTATVSGFDGAIDLVAVWNRAASGPSNLEQLVAFQNLRSDAQRATYLAPTAYWRLSRNGSIVRDQSGNGNDGVVIGALSVVSTPIASNAFPDFEEDVRQPTLNRSRTRPWSRIGVA